MLTVERASTTSELVVRLGLFSNCRCCKHHLDLTSHARFLVRRLGKKKKRLDAVALCATLPPSSSTHRGAPPRVFFIFFFTECRSHYTFATSIG